MSESLERYRRARDEIAVLLEELHAALTPAARLPAAREDLAELERGIARLRDGRFVLAVVGEFSSGKSFLLNALLGKIALEERAGATRIAGLLATDINPSTATITELSYAPEERATAYYPDGREERIPLDGLSRFVAVGDEAKLHDATGDERGAPTLVRVGVDSAFLKNGFVVADTPGLASINPAHRRATLTYLPGADAVLYLIDTQQPFTDGDASFLGIVRRYIESIFIVQTKIDLWRGGESGGEAWLAAAGRIVAQAAIHAPDTPVFPLSAREYAEGVLSGSAALVERSRFGPFLAALDASLVATTGTARLRRAAEAAQRAAEHAADALALDAAALGTDPAELAARRGTLEPALAALHAAAADGAASVEAAGGELRARVTERGEELRAGVLRDLARAFDVSDVARLRDRAKLHIIVDATLGTAVGAFADEIARAATRRLDDACAAAVADLAAPCDPAGPLAAVGTALAAERLPFAEDVANAFGADPGAGAWAADPETGLRGTIVLEALGGPSVSLVSAVAARFAGRPPGGYMKRELMADMGAEIGAAFDRELAAYVAAIGERVGRAAAAAARRIPALAERSRGETLGAIDRALETRRNGGDPAESAARLRAHAAAGRALAERIAAASDRFAAASSAERRALAGTALSLEAPADARRPDDGSSFDPVTYEHGLRPERWRVVVIGAFKRGKSSLINAIAGRRVLADEGGDAEFRYPVHVRYGPEPRAYGLTDDAAWEPIPDGAALEAALRTPVLIETPWSLPRELVLVHAPAFDSGLPAAEEIVGAAAAGASEILALFSRQLSDRELDLYGRLAPLGKPMTFVHTIADNEAPAERRNVVALAERYLRERAIVPQRIFTISTRDQGSWNELGALRATLQAHAEEHMERLRRARHEQAEHARLAASAAPAVPQKTSFLGRIFGWSRRV